MKPFYILLEIETKKEILKIVSLCVENNISFEFMNSKEMYFYIYDEDDFIKKQSILGTEIINEKNKVL